MGSLKLYVNMELDTIKEYTAVMVVVKTAPNRFGAR